MIARPQHPLGLTDFRITNARILAEDIVGEEILRIGVEGQPGERLVVAVKLMQIGLLHGFRTHKG